jgi:hypothetical protein
MLGGPGVKQVMKVRLVAFCFAFFADFALVGFSRETR